MRWDNEDVILQSRQLSWWLNTIRYSESPSQYISTVDNVYTCRLYYVSAEKKRTKAMHVPLPVFATLYMFSKQSCVSSHAHALSLSPHIQYHVGMETWARYNYIIIVQVSIVAVTIWIQVYLSVESLLYLLWKNLP